MVAAANLVEVAALVGDTARATMLAALMGGQSLTATELAYCANVSRSTASGHLSKLVAARLLTVTRKRRFSYYRIASPLVATMLESIKVVAAIEVPPPPSAAVGTRRRTPVCPKLLRSPGRSSRRRYYRRACGHGAHRAQR
jgi:DNA-binding transcriptional ArsR family regulator